MWGGWGWRWALAAAVGVGLVSGGAEGARRWSAGGYPNPSKDPVGCGRTAGDAGWVCDPDGLLGGDAGVAALDRLVADVRELGTRSGTSCAGFEVAVALMERVEGGDDGDAPGAARDMARALHDAWGVGDGRCDNGVVLLLARADRAVHISTGRGARAALPDGQARQVVEGMKPALRQGDVRGALEEALRAMRGVLSGETRLDEPHWLWEWWPVLLFVGVLAVSWAWDAVAAHRRRQWARCRQQLSAVEADRARVRAGSYEPTSCAICLDDFPEGTAERWRANEPALPGVEHLRCGHTFHAPCITRWLERNASCPICRESQYPGARPAARSNDAPDREPLLRATEARPRSPRSSVTASAPMPAPAPAFAPTSTSTSTRVVTVEDFEPELRFRLRRVNHFFPRFVDRSMLTTWETNPWTVSFAQDPRLLSRAPPQPAPAGGSGGGRAVSRSARHGAGATTSMSFGGGSSRGGGGAGGSW